MKPASVSATQLRMSSSVSVDSSADLDDRLDLLAELGMGHADHGGVEHLGVGDEAVLDLDAVDVLAAADDHVLLAVGDEEVAVGVDLADVAGVEPAVADRLGGRLGLAPVAGHERRAR